MRIASNEVVETENSLDWGNLRFIHPSERNPLIARFLVIVISISSLVCAPTYTEPIEGSDENNQSQEYETASAPELNSIPLDRLKQAKEALAKGDPNDFGLRFELGKALRDAGKHKEALEQFLGCFDEGSKHGSSQVGFRTSDLLSKISKLGVRYPPARKALVDRRNATSSAIQELSPPSLSGHPSREYFENATKLVGDFSALNRHIPDDANTLSLFQQLVSNPDRYSVVLEDLANRNLKFFIQNGLHEEIADVADVLYMASYTMHMHKVVNRFDDIREELPLDNGDIERSKERIFLWYEVLLATKRTKDAKLVADELADLWNEPQTYYLLATAGLRSKKPTFANVSHILTAIEGEHRNSAYYETYVRLLRTLGETDRAIQIAESHIDDPQLLEAVKDTIATLLKELSL